MLVSLPWPPGKPIIKDIYKNAVFLHWPKPEHDGGAKIESYVIELQKGGTDEWVRVQEGVPLPEQLVKGLIPMQDYAFRVRAVNRVERVSQVNRQTSSFARSV